MLKFLLARDLAEKRVGGKQHLVIEKDVVDADHTGVAQRDVVGFRVALKHLEAHTEVGVVVEIGAGGDHPVDETMLDERNQARHAQARRESTRR